MSVEGVEVSLENYWLSSSGSGGDGGGGGKEKKEKKGGGRTISGILNRGATTGMTIRNTK